MREFAGDNYESGALQRWIEKLTGDQYPIIQVPIDPVSRAEVIKEIFRLEVQTINVVTRRLKADLLRLTPFHWETRAERAQKIHAILEDDDHLRETWRDAVNDAHPDHSMQPLSDHDDSHFHYNSSHALEQLIEINDRGPGTFDIPPPKPD